MFKLFIASVLSTVSAQIPSLIFTGTGGCDVSDMGCVEAPEPLVAIYQYDQQVTLNYLYPYNNIKYHLYFCFYLGWFKI